MEGPEDSLPRTIRHGARLTAGSRAPYTAALIASLVHEESMPASHARRIAVIHLFTAMALLAPVSPVFAGFDAQIPTAPPERLQAVRARLEPTHSNAVQLEALRRRRAPDSLNILVVACDFSDSLMWGRDLAQFPGWPPQSRGPQRIPGTDIAVFDAHDSVYFDLQLERVNDYFRTVSFGAFQLEWAVHPEIYNVDAPMAWYADPDSGEVRLAALTQEIATAVDPDVDFTGFDTIMVIHAGAGAETDVNGDSPAQIPSNYLDAVDLADAFAAGVLDQPAIVTMEQVFEHVLILPESETQDPVPGVTGSGFFDVRGVYCFEVGLRLGMLSLADFTPSSFPDSQGIGNFGLMGYGLFTGLGIVPSAPGAINRMLMGWVPVVEVDADADLRIAAMGDPATAIADTMLLRVPVTDREYWLVEYRLQDPDGDLFYGFDDLNANYFPDYYDASNAANGGIPDSTFDPATDTWEDEAGAEVDFFMSENDARPPSGCRRGGGSGLYIWHIDEQVIENALLQGTNTINADVDHKGVDVEEADGIQDLDTYFSGVYLLGSDQDAWRGEGQEEFGPASSPSTASAAGLDTGIRFSNFSNVVLDSLEKVDGFCTGFVYAPAMRFRVDFGVGGSGPLEQARYRTDGFGPVSDLRVVDLGIGPQQPAPDGPQELVALADSGRVLVLHGDLSAFGPDEVLATAVAGDTLRWHGPAAVVDFDADGRLDLLAGSNAGIFAFTIDGSELIDGDGDPATVGRLVDAGGTGLGPAVLDGSRASQLVQSGPDMRAVTARFDPSDGLRILRTNAVQNAVPRSAVTVVDPGVFWAGFDRGGEPGRARFDLGSGAVGEEPDPDGFGGADAVQFEPAGMGPAVAWADSEGRPRIAPLVDLQPERSGQPVVGRRSRPVAAPVAEGGSEWVVAFVTADALWAFDANLAILPGFPARVSGSVAMPARSTVPEPVAVDLDGDGRIELVWSDGAGGLHATSLRGVEMPGWPVQGPASPTSSPVLGQLDSDPALELAVAGRFERLVSGEDAYPGFTAHPTGEIRVYELMATVDAYRPWSQATGGLENRALQTRVAGAATGQGLRADSFSVRPNPVTGTRVRLRADALGAVQAQLDIYTIEGERVLAQGPFTVPAGTALDVEFEVGELGSGTYICQLTAGGDVQRRLLSVVR